MWVADAGVDRLETYEMWFSLPAQFVVRQRGDRTLVTPSGTHMILRALSCRQLQSLCTSAPNCREISQDEKTWLPGRIPCSWDAIGNFPMLNRLMQGTHGLGLAARADVQIGFGSFSGNHNSLCSERSRKHPPHV